MKNSNEDVMYEVVTDTNGSSYLVNLDQVCEVVREEDWIHGEIKCLSNLALSWTITLSWGAKKTESMNQRSVLSDEGLQVGDHVVVENHGKQWPHKSDIVNIDMENNTAWIRWEITRKKDLVDLGDLTQFSLKDASPRKQKPTDCYNPSSGKKCIDWEMSTWQICFGRLHRKCILLCKELF